MFSDRLTHNCYPCEKESSVAQYSELSVISIDIGVTKYSQNMNNFMLATTYLLNTHRRVKRIWYLCVFYHRLLDYRKPEIRKHYILLLLLLLLSCICKRIFIFLLYCTCI